MENNEISLINEGFRELAPWGCGSCFGCGKANRHGLRLSFFAGSASLVSLVRVPAHLCGWSSMVHGGIIATMLDEIMGWTAIHFCRRLPLTSSMRIRYHRPVTVETPLRLTGALVERVDERQARMKARLYDDRGVLCAEAQGEFSLFTLETARKRGFADERLLREFAAMFGEAPP